MSITSTVWQFQEWLRQSGRSTKTVKSAARTAALFLEWLDGRTPSGTPAEIDAFLADQQRRRQWSAATVRDAQTALRTFLRYLGHNTSPDPASSPFTEWLQEQHHIAPATARKYQHCVQQFQNWWARKHGRPFVAGQVAAADIEAYWAELAAKPSGNLRPVRAALRYLAQWLQETASSTVPVDGLPLPEQPQPTRERLWLAPNEEERLVSALSRRLEAAEPNTWEASEALRDLTLCLLMLDAGLTPSEAGALPKEAVDLDRGQITVDAGAESQRKVPVTERLVELLARQMATPSPFLFPSQRSAHLSARAIQHRVAAWREAANLPADVTAYTLRHTFIRRRLEEGMSEADVATLVGLTRRDGKPLLTAVRRYKPNK